MVNIVLASHGKFAEGIMESGSMIFGPQKNVAAVVLTPDMGPDDMHKKLLDAIATFDDQEHVLFLVDLWGILPSTRSPVSSARRGTTIGSPLPA